jgi:DUF177 domain-containing protein
MRIELANLKEGRSSFAHVYELGELDLDDEYIKLSQPASVSGKLRVSGNRGLVDGSIGTQVQVECDRCLQPVVFPVQTAFHLEYVTGAEYEALRAVELSDDEMLVSVFDGEIVDIDEIVREQVLLSVPARVLCSQGCKGICTSCGSDLNLGDCGCETREIDLRWEALKKLKGS